MIIEKDRVFDKKSDVGKIFNKSFNAQSTYVFIDDAKTIAFWSITRDNSTNWSNKIVGDYVIESSSKKRPANILGKTRLLFIKENGKYIFNGVYKPIFIDEDNNTCFYKLIANKFDCKTLKAI